MKNKDGMRVPDSSEPQWDCLRCGQRMQKWRHDPKWEPTPARIARAKGEPFPVQVPAAKDAPEKEPEAA